MPIYEYTCLHCGLRFSHLHKRLNEPAPTCPTCQSNDVKKMISSFNAGAPATLSCAHASTCPAAQESGHTCCPGCCHHH